MLLIIGRQPPLPFGFAGGIGVDGLVAEEIQIDRRRDTLPDDVDLLARPLHRQQRAGHRTQASALRDRDGKIGVHRAGHRRERDRKFGLEEIQDTAIGPHGLSFRFEYFALASLPPPTITSRKSREPCGARTPFPPRETTLHIPPARGRDRRSSMM